MSEPPRDAKARGRRAQAQNGTAGKPQGSAAREELQRLFAPIQSFAVVSIADDGDKVLFEHYDDRDAADAVKAALAKFKLRAEVRTGIPRSVRPGTTIERAR